MKNHFPRKKYNRIYPREILNQPHALFYQLKNNYKEPSHHFEDMQWVKVGI